MPKTNLKTLFYRSWHVSGTWCYLFHHLFSFPPQHLSVILRCLFQPLARCSKSPRNKKTKTTEMFIYLCLSIFWKRFPCHTPLSYRMLVLVGTVGLCFHCHGWWMLNLNKNGFMYPQMKCTLNIQSLSRGWISLVKLVKVSLHAMSTS